MIKKVSGVCGGKACIANTRIPVWSIVRLMKIGASERDLLETYPTIVKQDLVDVMDYYDKNKKEIEGDISRNSVG